MNKLSKLKRGFTLLELVVVMAVLGILISIGSYAYKTSIEKTKDQRVKADLASVQNALESYKANDPNGSYPETDYAGLCTVLVPNYMQKLPYNTALTDPCAGNTPLGNDVLGASTSQYTYTPSCVASICKSYTLVAELASSQTTYTINQLGQENPSELIPTPTASQSTPTPTPGKCVAGGGACTSNEDCCSNLCEKGSCIDNGDGGGGGIGTGL
ncbi:MAG: prepilin-type N-terminal cleavage/methylation domain-containing protein [Patescibacteria group bacterium]